MIVVDANLLIYAHHLGSPVHREARAWLVSALQGPDIFGLAWLTILTFLRLTTNTYILDNPLTPAEATETVNHWFDFPAVKIVQPTERHWLVLRELLKAGQAGGDLVSDAHLAALAIEHGATVYSVDRDFARFPEVRFVNPLS